MPFDPQQAAAVLERTPQTLTAWLDGLPEALLAADEGPETFSPRDVVAHLLHGEQDDWIPRARRLLEEGEERAFDPFEVFGFRERFAGLETPELLWRFGEARAENLAALRALEIGDDALARRGLHPALGPVTLAELLATWAVHDLSHLAQVARVLSKTWRADVGPWRAYLPILDRP